MDYFEINELPQEILMKIFEYLNYDDLREASLVCHLWYDLLHRNQFLPSLSIVNVVKFDKDEDFEFLNNTNNLQNFKNWSIEDYEQQLLLNEKCQFHQRDSIKFLEITTGIIEIDYLIDVLLKFKNLEELKLEVNELTEGETFKESKNIHNLKSLTIFVSGYKGFRLFLDKKKFDLIKILDLFSNIESLAVLEYPLEQKDIEFITSKFGRTLKELHLTPDKYESERLHRIIKLSNLNLKKLKCNSVVLESSNFEEFIKTQKELVSLDLLDAYFLKDEFITNIIGNMKNLKELKVFCENNSFLKIIKFKNLKKIYSRWNVDRDIQEFHQGISIGENNYCKLHIYFEFDTEALSNFCKVKFPNLRALDFFGCSEVVTDSLLQLIFKNCTNLLDLDLSFCTQITDKGITGMNFNEDGGEQGVSIANLKGLRLLSLRECNITDFSLEFGLKFLELRFITILHCKHITKKGLEHLAQNCPSLVSVQVEARKSREILKKFKRLKYYRRGLYRNQQYKFI